MLLVSIVILQLVWGMLSPDEVQSTWIVFRPDVSLTRREVAGIMATSPIILSTIDHYKVLLNVYKKLKLEDRLKSRAPAKMARIIDDLNVAEEKSKFIGSNLYTELLNIYLGTVSLEQTSVCEVSTQSVGLITEMFSAISSMLKRVAAGDFPSCTARPIGSYKNEMYRNSILILINIIKGISSINSNVLRVCENHDLIPTLDELSMYRSEISDILLANDLKTDGPGGLHIVKVVKEISNLILKRMFEVLYIYDEVMSTY